MNIRSPNRRALRSFLLLPLLLRVPVSAQNAPGQNAPLFRAETRQVIVDVVVSDHNGHFVRGLKPNDFTVLENDRPQKIAAFTLYAQPASPPELAAPIELPRNQYTNYAIADPSRPITVVLMDMLNTWCKSVLTIFGLGPEAFPIKASDHLGTSGSSARLLARPGFHRSRS